MKYVKFTIFGILGLLLFACLLELAIRAFSPYPLLPPIFGYQPFTTIQTYNNREGCSKTSTFSTNQWGFRGPTRLFSYRNTYRIFLMGNSATICRNIDDSATWGAVLQDELRVVKPSVDVYNTGISAITTTSYVFILDKYLTKLKPDAVVFFTGTCDLGMTFRYVRKNTGSLIDAIIQKKASPSISKPDQWLMMHSRLVLSVYVLHRFFTRKVETQDFRSMNLPSPIQEKITPSDSLPCDDTLLYWLPYFEENIKKQITICKSRNTLPVFVFAPAKYSCDSINANTPMAKFRTSNNHIIVLSSCKVAKLYDQLEKSMHLICKENNVPYIDMNARINHADSCFIDETHFSNIGNKVMGHALADFIMPLICKQ